MKPSLKVIDNTYSETTYTTFKQMANNRNGMDADKNGVGMIRNQDTTMGMISDKQRAICVPNFARWRKSVTGE
ncbi:unnamed protein product [Nesidiocoris tenuis]|uniref:Uncharacterized protein n=1 Tax=Nesidiocoris tenuis TaxID=355587 RepID=A0A6H5HDD8_9HEMI|nr:unnamed protein product [Nesidiocoris tenuis]CAB0015764.1 unnamed protein product [Nesidiocoris tenuis]